MDKEARYFQCKVGGRPGQQGRDIAVFLARHWLVEDQGKTVKEADYWILQKWASKAISDAPSVRRAIRKAKKIELGTRFMVASMGDVLFVARMPLIDGSRCWAWWPTMTTAEPAIVRTPQGVSIVRLIFPLSK